MGMKSQLKIFMQKAMNTAMYGQGRQTDAIRCRQQLEPLMVGWSYLPLTDSAPGPRFLAHIVNEICIHRRHSILEFGSGISTILMARLARKKHLPLRILTVDCSQEWMDVVRDIARADDVEEYITFVRLEDAEDFIHGRSYDLVLVDGQAGDNKMKRFDAVPRVRELLNPSYIVFLHDTDREEEKTVMGLWSSMLQDAAVEWHERYATIEKNRAFWAIPQSNI